MEDRRMSRIQVLSYLKISERNTAHPAGRAMDIHAEGLRLRSEHSLEPDTTVQFKIAASHAEPSVKGLEFDADVIWCEKRRNPDYYESGIRLRNLTPELATKIEQIIDATSYKDHCLSMVTPRPQEY